MKFTLAFLFALCSALMIISINNEMYIFTFASAISYMAIGCVIILEIVESK